MNESETELPLQAVYELIPETATPAQVREIFDSTAICLAGFEGAWLHDGECDCAKRPGYESTVRQIANAYIKVLAEKRSASLYDRVEAWQKDFLKKHFTGSHGSTSYYGDAASGLAIALQEIDRERYDRTSSQVWSEAQSLAPSETSQSEGVCPTCGADRLSPEASARLIELLENPPAPNEKLKELFRKHGGTEQAECPTSGIVDPLDHDRMPNEYERFDDWWASACALPPYTLEHLRWAFNAGGMAQREIQNNMRRKS